MKKIHFTGERMIPDETSSTTFWEHIYRYRFASKYVKDKHVLDIACGEGYGTASLLQAGASSVIGIDISQDICEHARQKYNIDTRVGDAQNIPLPDRSVDLIVSFETIEHLENPEKFIQECRRVLSPKGCLIISTPDKEVYQSQNSHNNFHVNEFTRNEFTKLLQKYFWDLELYAQQPRSTFWFGARPFASPISPWLRIKGMYRLREAFLTATCPQLRDVEKYRKNVVDIILQKDSLLSVLANPFVVWPLRNQPSIYLIVIAR